MSRRIKAFLDTNILIDVLSIASRPNSEASRLIVQAICDEQIEGAVSTQSIMDAAFILSRFPDFSKERFCQSILWLNNYVNIYSIDMVNIRNAIRHPGDDFEDDVHYAFAVSTACDVIVTGDKGFLSRSQEEGYPEIPCLSPQAFAVRLTAQTSAQQAPV